MTNKLRVARVGQQLTQEELAKKVGVSRQTIVAIEAGNYVPSTLLALKLGQILGLPVEQIFQLEPQDIG
jgi:putative transcriptional regulator